MLKITLLEVPLLVERRRRRVLYPEHSPVGLLRLAAAAGRRRWQVELRDAEDWWTPDFFAGHENSRRAWLLDLHPYNWPTAALLLDGRRQRARGSPLVAAALSPGMEGRLSGRDGIDVSLAAGAESGWRRLESLSGATEVGPDGREGIDAQPWLPPVEQLEVWPRWDRHLCSFETFGFPPDRVPHPWNLPGPPVASLAEVQEWLPRCERALAACREPNLWLSLEREAPGLDLLSALGDLALRALRRESSRAGFGLRAAPPSLLHEAVPANLSLLEIRHLDLLAGSFDPAVLDGRRAGYGPDELSECLSRVAGCGLARRTRAVFVLGTPEESADSALRTVQSAIGSARKHGLRSVSFEWWCNLEGSPTFQPQYDSAMAATDFDEVWFRNPAPPPYDFLDERQKRAIAESIQLLALAHPDVEIRGPALI